MIIGMFNSTYKDLGVARFLAFVVAVGVGLTSAVFSTVTRTFAGDTIYAVAAFWLIAAVSLLFGYVVAWRRGAFVCGVLLTAALVSTGLVVAWQTRAWTYFLNDVLRTFGDYVRLMVLVTVLPLAGVPLALAGCFVATMTGRSWRGIWLTVCVVLLGVLVGTRIPATWYMTAAWTVAAGCGAAALLSVFRVRRIWIACVVLPLACVAGFFCAGTTPTLIPETFVHVVYRDTGFSIGTPTSITRADGHTVAEYVDEDYGTVTTMDGRPLIFSGRFSERRAVAAAVPLLLNPTAQHVICLGREARVYSEFYQRAGLTCATSLRGKTPRDARYDIVFVANEPVWLRRNGGYSRRQLMRYRAALAREGVMALHLDARALPFARFAAIVADVQAVFPHIRVWQTAAAEWVIVGGVDPLNVLAEDVLALFDAPKMFEALARADIRSPADFFGGIVGDGATLAPALATVAPQGRWSALWAAPRVVFDATRQSILRAEQIVPEQVLDVAWFKRGTVDATVFATLMGKVDAVMRARRLALRGQMASIAGDADDALEFWAQAAIANPRDWILRQTVDTLDLEGRRRLRVGDTGGALKCYENMILIDPNNVLAIYNFACCLKKLGRLDLAMQALTRAVSLNPEMDAFRMTLADCATLAGAYDVAREQYTILSEKHPADPQPRFLLAEVLANPKNAAREPARAIALAEQVCKDTAWKRATYVRGLADIYLNCGRVLEGAGLKKRMRTMTFERESVGK